MLCGFGQDPHPEFLNPGSEHEVEGGGMEYLPRAAVLGRNEAAHISSSALCVLLQIDTVLTGALKVPLGPVCKIKWGRTGRTTPPWEYKAKSINKIPRFHRTRTSYYQVELLGNCKPLDDHAVTLNNKGGGTNSSMSIESSCLDYSVVLN